MQQRYIKPLLKGWIFAVLFLPSEIFADTNVMQIRAVQIHYKDPNELLPIVSPLLPQGSVVTASQDQLIIKTTEEGFHTIMPVIGDLDHLPQTLLIRVRRIHNPTFDAESASDGGDYVVGTQTQNQFDDEQRITVEDGSSAFVKTGESFPVQNWSVFFWGASSDTYYKKITSGFYVKAKLRGDQVSLSIDWKHNALQDQRTLQLRNQSAIDVEETNSAVTIPLAKWVSLSNSAHRSLTQSDENTYSTQDVTSPDKNVFIRVDVASNVNFDNTTTYH